MNEGENRQIARDSLFLMADLRVDGLDSDFRIKVRNLSAGGMMGEGSVRVVRGTVVQVNIRNVGWVEGSVAWVQDSRFGVAFREDIDPRLAREPVSRVEDPTPEFIRKAQVRVAADTVVRKI
ncbi:PilZ domain-containing protein [Novosphingobium sp. AP12]|uniref:PilZ domain-containing protein n=1 Tax=Novosphingobium sp. AP12 TaxID=1144305 RepID=UPI000271FBC8|nr:PilZ domain-containing protein [Novosphingobium sp. AP12]EJL21110.1 PilZ domain-containing protein [Novosphingobium sp. AP12]